jgi:hypothetical protein
MRFAASLILVTASVFTAACGPDCQSTCQKLYASDDGGCSLPTPGRDAAEAVDSCEDECSLAIQQPGNIGSYDPRNPSSGTVTELENEKQAAAWMDCIAETDCTLIADGLCQPRP